MASFLPSYFQKRLLRYALSRLDFIDSDALDLDNLDLSFGQRSVIELKNVGIKVDQLIEKIQLPSALDLKHASIRVLRITVPADLHYSGIEIEVDGIDVEVEVGDVKSKDEGEQSPSAGAGYPPSHKDVANRPRIASPAIHDPGGVRRRRGSRMDESVHLVPTSEDLAASFLADEPEDEKEELRAAVASSSLHMPRTTGAWESRYDDEEDGTGMPDGFSLPGFVANFFAGVADRLSVLVRNVAVVLTMNTENESGVEVARFLLKIEQIQLQGVSSHVAQVDNLRRAITIHGVEVLLLADSDNYSQRSAVSSPRLNRSQASVSASRVSRYSAPMRASTRSAASSSSTPSSPASDLARFDPQPPDSMLASSQLFHSGPDLRAHSTRNSSPESTRSARSSHRRSSGSGHWRQDDLAESKVFSHDEAESMFMSAMSTAPADHMPGGWSMSVQSKESPEMSANVLSQPPSPRMERSQRTLDASAASRKEAPTNTPSLTTQTTKDLFDIPTNGKRLLSINYVNLRLPLKSSQLHTIEVEEDPLAYGTLPPRRRDLNRSSYAADQRKLSMHSRATSGQSFYASPPLPEVELDSKSELRIDVGRVDFAVDLNVCQVLIKTGLGASRVLASSGPATSETTTAKPADLQISTQVGGITVALFQQVPEVNTSSHFPESTSGSTFMPHHVQPLLALELQDIRHKLFKTSQTTKQKLTINRLAIGRGSEKILSFYDPSALNESFVASSVVLDTDDIVIQSTNERFDILTKPVRVSLDLVLMDDVLSKSGGLSSLLDLGNSFASTDTIKDEKVNLPKFAQKPRGVHFDESPRRPRSFSDADSPGLKINLRVAGSIIDLAGSESLIQVKTSSIKAVHRSTGLQTRISSITVRGPHRTRQASSEGLAIKIADLHFSFLNNPEEQDLERLMSLVTPSSDKYDASDDIMVDTLMRQRRKGAVMRIEVSEVQVDVVGLLWVDRLTQIVEELSKLSSVTKYLPEDDRPGILTFGLVRTLNVYMGLDRSFGPLTLRAKLLEGAQISVPSLMAAQISSFQLSRGKNEQIVRELIPNMQESSIMGPPMFMCRFIADEMEPTVRLKLSGVCLEYSVPLLLAVTGLVETLQSNPSNAAGKQAESPSYSNLSSAESETSDFARKVRISLVLRNSGASLNPLNSNACGILLFSDAVFSHTPKQHGMTIQGDVRKASFLVIDDIDKSGNDNVGADPKLYFDQNDYVQELAQAGFVPVGSISSATAGIKITTDKATGEQFADIEFRNNLFYLETCADSFQTILQIANGLAPPSPPSPTQKYRTEIVPIQDMLASFTGEAFVSEQGNEMGMQASRLGRSHHSAISERSEQGHMTASGLLDDGEDETFVNDLYKSQAEDAEHDYMAHDFAGSESSHSSLGGSVHIAPVNITADAEPAPDQSIMMHSLLDLRDNHFTPKTSVGGTAHRWDAAKNTYDMGSEAMVQQSPLKVRVRDVHIIWNLFDGYDWQNTRDVITEAVHQIEEKALAKQRRRDSRRSPGPDEEDESVIGDVLFNSIYISIPTNKDPRGLADAINMGIGDAMSETGSYATSTTVTATPSKRSSTSRVKPKKLKLKRSKQHKLTFELQGLSADFLVFPPSSGEVESSLDVRVNRLEIFDHVPTSTWKKFATYMHEAGEREVGTDMVHIEVLNVRPVAELAASEMVLKLTVLPLRLHVDQDALDFMTRFFEFKDDRAPVSTSPSNPPFIQRAEINPIKLRLDFKPKRVDYGGIRSGRTSEFMNFFILDRADILLRRVILYGVSGLDRLGLMLHGIWSPDVTRNQLPTVLAGLAPIRSLVDVGSGVKDLIAVPIQEYRKDGRLVRSIQKGAIAFAKTTTTELVNLGAKLAIGTQTVLQNAEGVLVPQSTSYNAAEDEDERKQISLYADQPLGIVQGLRGAYASLERDLLLAKDAIVAVPGEVMSNPSATGAAKAVLKQSPTIILRPAIGVTKAMGQALLGAGNTLDKTNRKRIEDKYKRY